MKTFAEVADYGVSPERLHRIMVYPDTLPGLTKSTRSWQPDELPPRVGTLVRIRSTFLGMKVPFEVVTRFSELDPPRHMVTELVRPTSVTMRWALDLEQVPGGARATNTFEISWRWWAAPLGRVFAAIVRREVRVGMRKLLAQLGPPR